MTTLTRPTIYGLFCACSECREEHPGEIRYVGQTIQSANSRLKEHRKHAKARRGDYPVYRWIIKHGPENIRTFVLDYPETDINVCEHEWMTRLGTYGTGRGLNASPAPTVGILYPRPPAAKFTDNEVAEIKVRIWNGESAASIAESLKVPSPRIYQIKQGRSYSDVPWPIGPWNQSSGRADHIRKMKGRKQSPERLEKFRRFLDSWDDNPFKGEQPVQWTRKSKLSRTELHIRDIRRIRNLQRDGLTASEISDVMPAYVTKSQASRIMRGERWAWVE